MAKNEERVLLYQFPAEQAASAQETLRALRIRTDVLPSDVWHEKVGCLLGRKGFRPTARQEGAVFVFPHRVILFDQIQGKRLTRILTALEDAGIPRIAYKASITPYNTLWTLRYLCEHMEKEHGAATLRREGST